MIELHMAHGYLLSSFITPIARRKENLFICLPDGITAMWDGVVHEAPHRRATEASFAKKGMRKLGRIRALRTQQNKWVLQTSEAAKATLARRSTRTMRPPAPAHPSEDPRGPTAGCATHGARSAAVTVCGARRRHGRGE